MTTSSLSFEKDMFPPNDRPETIVLSNKNGDITYIRTFPESALREPDNDDKQDIPLERRFLRAWIERLLGQ